jgi:phytol kinase
MLTFDFLLPILATCALVFALLLTAEIGRRKRWLSNELGRKSVHITVGCFVAFWPLFLSWPQIIGLSVAFVMGIAVSRACNIFRAIHSVQRPTWGEVYFAIAVGLLALVTQDGWVYMAALLHMALADGLAAIVGVEFGKATRYKVLGHTKSIVGSATFFVTSLGIIAVYSHVHVVTIMPLVFFAIAGVATLLENISIKGLDNISVPVWVAVVLTLLT